jgi:hypothetical protein
MSAFKSTIFNNEPDLSEINRGVELLQHRIVLPSGNVLSQAGTSDLANDTFSFEVKPPAGYYFLPGSLQFRCEILLKAGNSGNAPSANADTCLAMGAPHALFSRVEHIFGGTVLLNDGSPYQSAMIQHFRGASKLEDNSVQTDGYWVDQRYARKQHTGFGAVTPFGQRIPLRWQPATPFFETGQALWCGGATHEFRLTGHNLWRSRILDSNIANCLGNTADTIRVEIYNLAFHAVFAKMDKEYGPERILPRHVNYKQDYASVITVPSGLVVEPTTVDKTFTVQAPGFVTQIYCWLQEDDRGGTAAGATPFKPLHFFDGHMGSSIKHRNRTRWRSAADDPLHRRVSTGRRMRGEEAYNDLIDALCAVPRLSHRVCGLVARIRTRLVTILFMATTRRARGTCTASGSSSPSYRPQ